MTEYTGAFKALALIQELGEPFDDEHTGSATMQTAPEGRLVYLAAEDRAVLVPQGELLVTTAGALRLRADPGLGGQILVDGIGPKGTGVHPIVEGSVEADSYHWRYVRVLDSGAEGWAAADFLEVPGVTPPEPTPPDDGGLTDEPDHQFTFEELWPTIQSAAAEYGFDPQVLAGIIMQESGFRNYRVHFDGTGHGLGGLDDNGMLPDFERWSGISVGRGGDAISIPIVPQIRYLAMRLADYAQRFGGPYAAARAWHRGSNLMDDARGQQYEALIRAHVQTLFG